VNVNILMAGLKEPDSLLNDFGREPVPFVAALLHSPWLLNRQRARKLNCRDKALGIAPKHLPPLLSSDDRQKRFHFDAVTYNAGKESAYGF
jgi:hypothetical protein